MKALLQRGDQPLNIYERLLSGSTAGVIAQTSIYPMEVLKIEQNGMELEGTE